MAPSLPGWWLVSKRDALPAALQPLATPGTADGSAAERLLATDPRRARRRRRPRRRALADLPLVELPADKPGDLMAVIYSGDGGWRDIDKQIGEALAAAGVPVVGVDSLRYFWRERTPDEVGHDLAQIIDVYTARWKTPRVALVGYSFGADILPFAYNRLPAAARDRVALVSLLGVEPRAAFEFSVTGWLGGEPPADAPAVLPEVLRIPPGKVQCFYGDEEEDTLCRDPALAGAEIIQHHRRPPLRRRLRRPRRAYLDAAQRAERTQRRALALPLLHHDAAQAARDEAATLASTRGSARPPV